MEKIAEEKALFTTTTNETTDNTSNPTDEGTDGKEDDTIQN